MKSKKVKIVVAMSGGVDSSVSAVLLKQAGFDVVGVYMRQWSPEILGKECIWKQDRQDAMRVCAKLNIPFFTWDFSKEYKKQVGKYMIDSYKKGITPNPDVMCNKVIKFGLFYDKAMKNGADFVATGHYARTSLAPLSGARLLKAKDQNKDQTYFLYEIKKNQLSKIIFPVGNLEKPEVRKLAKKFGLQNAAKKDSQGVCFIGQFNMKEFLKMYIKPKIGAIVDLNGNIIGEHDGVFYYTIGQRHGLNIKNGQGPYFVIRKDLKKNIIYVGREKNLQTKKAKIVNINWIEKPKKFPIVLDVRTRYRAPLKKAKLSKNGDLVFQKGERAITSGQSAVFYKGQQLLGGGIIK
ncbi:MAG: tRNA 2-thiouridine(34) synthase MnmA [Candidatus Staskawiczbacteria bacterium]|nr:tRNA 2-thiouridine(34) synthase MnmA [Candidatus Staskawiczbacteria bacterium]